ncbi:unnamed protein product [Blepharisma stoltei]|uniref:Uncharacterized protein n=1 Tax=Blepharisma stoltei TaxID=1481888 RepID=A0AAU9J4N8_9CILI|nr:unnamed protein product [Blepharisma stoltei]
MIPMFQIPNSQKSPWKWGLGIGKLWKVQKSKLFLIYSEFSWIPFLTLPKAKIFHQIPQISTKNYKKSKTLKKF